MVDSVGAATWRQSIRSLAHDFERVMELVASGAVTPVVDHTWPLEDVEGAYDRLSSGSQFGKVVVQC